MKRLSLSALLMLTALGCAQETTTQTTTQATTETVTTAAPMPSALPADGIVTIKVAGDFQPSVINAKAGQPLTLRFDRTAGAPSCGDEVVFKSLNQTYKVPDKQITEVKLTPQQTGDLHFTCGMNMMKGKIVVQ
jgi:hypothetical protein